MSRTINTTNPASLMRKKIRITANINGHGYIIGDICTIINYNPYNDPGRGNAFQCIKDGSPSTQSYWVYRGEFELYRETAREIRKQLRLEEARVLALQLKLEYLRESDSNEIDLDEFKSFMMRRIITGVDETDNKIAKIKTLMEST